MDFLIDDFQSMSVLPIEVKSGKDYKKHSALTHFITNPDYNIQRAFVLSNNRKVEKSQSVVYLPIYFVMCIQQPSSDLIIPDVE